MDPLFATVHVDDHLLARAQRDPTYQTTLITSVSLASDHVRLIGPGEKGKVPIVDPKKRTHTKVDALGYTIRKRRLRFLETCCSANGKACA